jgi:hypothetical protein
MLQKLLNLFRKTPPETMSLGETPSEDTYVKEILGEFVPGWLTVVVHTVEDGVHCDKHFCIFMQPRPLYESILNGTASLEDIDKVHNILITKSQEIEVI